MAWHGKKATATELAAQHAKLLSSAQKKLTAAGVDVEAVNDSIDSTLGSDPLAHRDRERARKRIAKGHVSEVKRLREEHTRLHKSHDPWAKCQGGEECGSRFEWLRAHAVYVALYDVEAVEGIPQLWARLEQGTQAVAWRARELGLTFREIAALWCARLEKSSGPKAEGEELLEAIARQADTLKRAAARFEQELAVDEELRRLALAALRPPPP